MNDQSAKHDLPEGLDEETVNRAAVALRSIGHPNSIARAYDFWDDRYAWRRLFSEVPAWADRATTDVIRRAKGTTCYVF